MQALSREVSGVSGELAELFAGSSAPLLYDSDTRLAELLQKLFVLFNNFGTRNMWSCKLRARSGRVP